MLGLVTWTTNKFFGFQLFLSNTFVNLTVVHVTVLLLIFGELKNRNDVLSKIRSLDIVPKYAKS